MENYLPYLQLIVITNDPGLAQAALVAGVNRIMIDLETLGKMERQRGRNTLISDHRMEDISRVRAVVSPGTLMTRINPLHPYSPAEIDEAISRGSDYLMLPMFRTAAEARRFVELLRGRTKAVLLLETAEARDNLDAILSVPGIEEIHVGLNDLSMELGMPFLFQVLAEGIIDELAAKVRRAGIRFGFGGVGRMYGAPLPGELIIAEHKRVGSEMVILSRVFHGDSKTLADFERKGVNLPEEIARLRAVERQARSRTPEQVECDRRALQRRVQEIVHQLASA